MILRVRFSTQAAQVRQYHVEAPSQEAYYSEGQEFSGFWFGKAAAKMGLTGRVGKDEFALLTENVHPVLGGQLTPKNRTSRRIGADFNFNCPKSVSLAYMWTKDERILQAFRQAVRDTMLEIETLMATRVRRDGCRDGDRKTGNLVGAEFIHLTARPENGVPDPHLHAHCFVFNVTFDPVEQKFKAGQFREIMEELDYFDGACASRLATNLKALGLRIATSERSFEIDGIARSLIEKFSSRGRKIMAEAERRGFTTAKERDGLAAITREKKHKSRLIPEIEPLWWERLSANEKTALNTIKSVLQRSRQNESARESVLIDNGRSSEALGGRKSSRRVSLNRATMPVNRAAGEVKPTADDRTAVAFAVEHVFERASIVTERQLIGEAFKSWSYGKATLEGIKQVVEETPFIRINKNARNFLTTTDVLAEEKRITAACKEGKNALPSLNPSWEVRDRRLNQQQRAAVLHVLQSTDSIVGIKGKAGTGKTTLLQEARRGIEAGGGRLIVLAPTSEAARDVLRNEGFENSETVAKMLSSKVLQAEYSGAVWWIDEAGLLSTRLMDKVRKAAKAAGARIVLSGDPGQHRPVERGQAFDLLERFGEMSVVSVDEIQRQRGTYKRLVEHVQAHRIDEAFAILEREKWLFEGNTEQRHEAVSKDFVEAIKKGENIFTTSPTHAEGKSVTEAIRTRLKAEGIVKHGRKHDVLRNLRWTEAERKDARHYADESGQMKPGLVAQINGPVKGFKLGKQLEVVKVRDGVVRVRSLDDPFHLRIKTLPLEEAERFAVYERDMLEIGKGDRIRITGNSRSVDGHHLNNGTFYTVDHVALNGDIVLNNGWRLGRDFKHVAHGYVTTSHGAQGKTVDRILLCQSAASFPASDINQFYVSVSRGRYGVKIYTDDIELLKEAVSNVRERPMATEILQPESTERLGTVGRDANENLSEQLRAEMEIEAEHEMELEPDATSARLGCERKIELELDSFKSRAQERELEIEL